MVFLFVLVGLASGAWNCSSSLKFTSDGGRLNVNGQPFRLKGVSWFGYETSNNVFHGLWAVDFNFLLEFCASRGFNALRIPFYLDLVLNDATPTSINYYCSNNKTCNHDLQNKTSLQVLDRIIEAAADNGLLIMLDMHSFGPGTFMQDGLWYDKNHPESMVLKGWETLINRYKNQWNVVAIDVKNEPHDSTWGTGVNSTDWNTAVERIGSYINEHTDWLVFAEGTGNSPECVKDPYGPSPTGDACFWGEDFLGAVQHPIKISKPNKLVYSPHVYGPDVAPQKYFDDPTFPNNMPRIWHTHWSFLRDARREAIVVGEWGGSTSGKNGVWYKAFTAYLKQIDATDNFFWCLNPDSGDTGGLLKDDWVTPVEDKLSILADLVPKPSRFQKQGTQLCVDI